MDAFFFFGSLVFMKFEEMPSIFFQCIGFGLELQKHCVDPFIDIKLFLVVNDFDSETISALLFHVLTLEYRQNLRHPN